MCLFACLFVCLQGEGKKDRPIDLGIGTKLEGEVIVHGYGLLITFLEAGSVVL